MDHLTLNQPVAEAVRTQSFNHGWLPKEFAKVRGVLKAYALREGLTLSKLTVLHVCDDRHLGQINHRLEAFIRGLPKSRAYVGETVSRLGRIVRHLAGAAGGHSAYDAGQALAVVPDFLKPILPFLQRDCTSMNGVPPSDTERRLQLPLTASGQRVLLLLLGVVKEYGVGDVESLFVGYRSAIYTAVRESTSPDLWGTTYRTVGILWRKLGYGPLRPRGRRACLSYDEWPATLRGQFERLKELASHGIVGLPGVVELSTRTGVSVSPLSAGTVAMYQKALSYGLYRILSLMKQAPCDVDVRDLLRLEPEEYEHDGVRTTRLVNPLVELYRGHELRRANYAKRAGFDSVSFRHFFLAVRGVAAYNGYFTFLKAFDTAYRLSHDKKLIEDRREHKKETFDLNWIDGEIARMYPAFRRVVRRREFVFGTRPDESGPQSLRKKMRFCLFFVCLVMLRYMGHRQQQIRNCIVGRHVVFGPGDSIHFNWKPGEVKNRKELDQLLRRDEHKTHWLMIDVLFTYYRRVYPYVVKHADVGADGRDLVGGQLFVRITRSGGFACFPPLDHQLFYNYFCSWSREFMHFGDRNSKTLHPHYFRGLATDWMIDDLGVTISKASEFFGDSEETLRRHYRRKNVKMKAAPALDEANENLRAKELKERPQPSGDAAESPLKEELRRTEELLQKAHGRIDELQTQLIEALKNRRPDGGPGSDG